MMIRTSEWHQIEHMIEGVKNGLMSLVQTQLDTRLAEEGLIMEKGIYARFLHTMSRKFDRESLENLLKMKSEINKWVHDVIEEYAVPPYEQSIKLKIFGK